MTAQITVRNDKKWPKWPKIVHKHMATYTYHLTYYVPQAMYNMCHNIPTKWPQQPELLPKITKIAKKTSKNCQ